MDSRKWQKLNLGYHEYIEDPTTIKAGKRRPPPYMEQASMLNILSKNRLLNLKSSLDWGSGYGTLANILERYYDIKINAFDRYMPPRRGRLTEKELADKKFSVVINSAVFEHITDRKFLDEINELVSEDGCLVFHTLVCETIPQDPEWFYLLPVHTAFHTNKSMELLMAQWGYESSVYCPLAKAWILFKKTPKGIRDSVDAINLELQYPYLFYKKGFVDYWK